MLTLTFTRRREEAPPRPVNGLTSNIEEDPLVEALYRPLVHDLFALYRRYWFEDTVDHTDGILDMLSSRNADTTHLLAKSGPPLDQDCPLYPYAVYDERAARNQLILPRTARSFTITYFHRPRLYLVTTQSAPLETPGFDWVAALFTKHYIPVEPTYGLLQELTADLALYRLKHGI